MKTIKISCPSMLIKEENSDTLMTDQFQMISKKRFSEYKEETNITSQIIISQKIIDINEIPTALNFYKNSQDESFNHYTHYLKTFQSGSLHHNDKKATFSSISNNNQKKIVHIPYSKLADSLSFANITNNSDDFRQSWIDFMENYSCDKIGLNLGFQVQQNELTYKDGSYQKMHLKISLSKIQKKLNHKNQKLINIHDIVRSFSIPTFLEGLIKNKFCLYIQSSYKILKSNCLENQSAYIDTQIFNLLFSNNNASQNQINHQNIENTSYTPIMNTTNSSNLFESQSIKKNPEQESSQPSNDLKKYHFNMSKYFMLLILELFRTEHLDGLQVSDAIISEIQSVVTLIQSISKKNTQSKTNYYNHFHYDVLFLQINDNTKSAIIKNKKLFEMHQKVFRMQNLNCQFTIERINIIKQYLSQIILSQLTFLKKNIQEVIKGSSLSKQTIEDVNSKIDYLYRVEQGIKELNLGKTINRF